MFVDRYFESSANGINISKVQGSDFAKIIAGDFNPLHDIDNTRFCVPGDLLFAVVLRQCGVSQSMSFHFKEMLGGDVGLQIHQTEQQIQVIGENDKNYLNADISGDSTQNGAFVETLIHNYVAFSGETFPNILVRLMKNEGVMINVEKPMVIYENMQLTFSRFTTAGPDVVLKEHYLEVNGKRGKVIMQFDLNVDGETIGQGKKQILLSGLRPFEQDKIDWLVDFYANRKSNYLKEHAAKE
ncbi:DUF3581 family protein [Aliikangiella maris]|uniref:DUF3581 family protein n=2 Tax=Aliikangiella maris TaxID=3162458 RepID=A0ABV3MJE6_9GAMM